MNTYADIYATGDGGATIVAVAKQWLPERLNICGRPGPGGVPARDVSQIMRTSLLHGSRRRRRYSYMRFDIAFMSFDLRRTSGVT